MALDIVWSTPAMGMVPAARTVREQKYVTTAGRVKFDIGQSGTITFIAPVTVPLPEDMYTLRAELERTSPDRFGTEIKLRRARRGTGAVSTILTCVGVQSGTVTNNVRFTDSEQKRFAINLGEYYYWVQIDDTDSTPATSRTVKATIGVALIRG